MKEESELLCFAKDIGTFKVIINICIIYFQIIKKINIFIKAKGNEYSRY